MSDASERQLLIRVLPDVSAIERTFDYLVPEHLDALVRVGAIVRVPLHGRRVRGWVVAAGLARRCEAQVAYAIGVAHPVSIMVDTFGTSEIAPDKLEAMVRDVFDMRPAAIIERLDLRRPIFRRTAAYGHFGRTDGDGFTWENVTSYADELRRMAG